MGHDAIFLVLLGFLAGLYLVNAVMAYAAKDPMPGANIGELIAAKKAADKDEAAKAVAYAAAREISSTATAGLKAALANLGPVLVQNPDDTLEIWLPDATAWPVQKKTDAVSAQVPTVLMTPQTS